ncbi:MAG TPA: ATP-binding cassette domain-containing protein [Candidatus Limnocylindrales bacterium]|nr:ATP-binding cassette domain-containing protein [Candidatus Limnocylindrales bacterium]
MIAIDAAGLTKTYWYYEKEPGLPGALRGLFRMSKTPVEAVRDLNFEVRLGEVVGFIGPNGAGKTTTLKMLCGILHPSEGRLVVLGFTPSRREKAFLKNIAYISGQRNRLFWDLPAEDYFRFCKAVYEIPEGVYERNRRRVIEVAEIGDILSVPQRKLSFGQRKRCELAAALLHDPKIILLDEPTNAMDLLSAGRVRKFIREEAREGNRAVIVTSHNMSDIESVCERVTILDKGKILYDGLLRNLNHTGGSVKRIRVRFQGPWQMESLRQLGEVTLLQEDEISLEVDPAHAPRAASRLLATAAVRDISITEPSLEEILGSIYGKTSDGRRS